ncbi:MAG: AcrR family transcriptional regulator [Bermanella sp.]|jgi:AcrR family transcriptional regulator
MNKAGIDQETAITTAAAACYLKHGITKTGMLNVAREAGVARSTLYRYFPSSEDLLVATIKQEMLSSNTTIQNKLKKFSDPADLIVEGILIALKEILKRPLLKAVFASDEDARARRLIWRSDVIIRFGEELMASVLQQAVDIGLLQTKVKPELLIEWVYRILLSFLTLPSNWINNDAELRTTLHALLVPVLLR